MGYEYKSDIEIFAEMVGNAVGKLPDGYKLRVEGRPQQWTACASCAERLSGSSDATDT